MGFNLLKFLDADDIFISYSREDGLAYLTGLDAALSANGFSCFTDRRGTDANPLPPETLFRKIRLCKTLVLLATPSALKNPSNIAPEVREFAETNGTSRIICVSFDRDAELADWSKTPWYSYVQGKAREREDLNTLKTGEPSPGIVQTVVKASDYMKSKDRLRKYRNRALIGFFCLLMAGIVAGVFAFSATVEARRQSLLSNARSLANRSQMLLRQHPEQLLTALSLAVDSMQKTSAIGIHTVEADSAIRESLALVPVLRKSDKFAGHNEYLADIALSPDGRFFAMLSSENNANRFAPTGTTLRIYDATSPDPLLQQRPLKEIGCECSVFALSSNLSYAAAVTSEAIEIFDLKNDTHSHLIKLEKTVSPSKVALSPGGRYLALSWDEGEDMGRLSKMMVLDATNGQSVTKFNDLNMLIKDMAFGPSGNLAIAGEYKSPQGGRLRGRVFLWSLPLKLSGADQEPTLTAASFEDFETIPTRFASVAVAPGPDSTYFATDEGVWKRPSGNMEYEIIARFPYIPNVPSSSSATKLSFASDGRSLTLTRSISARDQNDNEADGKVLEVWEMPGHADLAHVFQPKGITSVGFKPDEPLVVVMTEQPTKEEPAGVFRAVNGEQVGSISFEPEPESKQVKTICPGGGYILNVDNNGAVVWDIWGRRKVTLALDNSLQDVDTATINRDGKFLAVAGPNKEGQRCLFVYRLDGTSYRNWKSIPQLRKEFETPVRMSLSDNGQRLAVTYSYSGQFVCIWDVCSGTDVSPDTLKDAGDVSLMTLSPRGRLLALTDLDDNTELLDLSKGRKSSLMLLLESTNVRCLAFSSDERYLALGSEDGIVHIFDTLRPVDEIARLQHTGEITAVDFSADSRYVATASSDHHPNHLDEDESFPLRIWLLQPDDLIAEAKRRLAAVAK